MLALERKPQRIKQRFFHPNLNIFDGVHLGIEKGDCFSLGFCRKVCHKEM